MRSGIHALCALLSAATLPAQFGGFRAGDLYLWTPSPLTASTAGYMILHVDPVAAVTTPLIHMQDSPVQFAGAVYDSFRNRILVHATPVGAVRQLWAIDAAGNATGLGHAGVTMGGFAPRGDGIVYCRASGGGPNQLQYLDAAGNLQTLMDASGAVPYSMPVHSIRVYHSGQNALFLANGWTSANAMCSGSVLHATVLKVPLSPDGMRAIGPVTCGSFAVSATAPCQPRGLSLAPDGRLLLVVSTNTNLQEPRMLLVDPVTLAITPYARNGPYPGAGTATTGGIWSQVLGRAVILDTFSDVLRAYGPGDLGSGTVLAPLNVSGPGFAELVAFFEIGPPEGPSRFHGSPRTISVSSGGSHTLHFDGGAALAGATYWMLGSASGWTPGLMFRGERLWVVPDFYTDYTLVSVNSGFLGSTAGVLDAFGRATGTVTTPPGLPAEIAGLVLHHVTCVFDASFQPLFASSPVSMLLVP